MKTKNVQNERANELANMAPQSYPGIGSVEFKWALSLHMDRNHALIGKGATVFILYFFLFWSKNKLIFCSELSFKMFETYLILFALNFWRFVPNFYVVYIGKDILDFTKGYYMFTRDMKRCFNTTKLRTSHNVLCFPQIYLNYISVT